MKKLIFVFAALVSVSTLAYAGSKQECDGANKFLTNLNLDDARAQEAQYILRGYKQVKDLAKSGRAEEIPEFIEAQNAQLKMVLTDDEYHQFKENIGEWAEDMDFSKYQSFAGKSKR